MKNGENNWGVPYRIIVWFETAVSGHQAVSHVERHDDIIFEVYMASGKKITAICPDEYVCGLTTVARVEADFPDVSFIYVGGMWNGYTMEAKEYCRSRKIGLYNSSEINGALFKDEYWDYYKKDKKGNPKYQAKRS